MQGKGYGADGMWADIVAEVAASDAEAAEAALIMAAPHGLHTEDYSDLEQGVSQTALGGLIDDVLAAKDRSLARVHVYAPPGDDAAERAEDARRRLAAAGVRATVEARAVREEDWANNWKRYFKPLRVGERIVVRPAWEDLRWFPAAPGDVVLAVDPGMAFGTGSHATTRLCLELLERRMLRGSRGGGGGHAGGGGGQAHPPGGPRVLDVGTGSGILAVASLLLGAGRALGIDIDGHALKNARANAELNGVAGRAEFRVGDLAHGVGGDYDIILANIIADSVASLIGDMPRLLAPGGAAIVSGIIEEREADVRGAAQGHGFVVATALREPPWVALELAYA